MVRATGSCLGREKGHRPGGFLAVGFNPQVGYRASLWLFQDKKKGQRPDPFLPADLIRRYLISTKSIPPPTKRAVNVHCRIDLLHLGFD